MNSFLILMFFKDAPTKKNVVLIISLVKIFKKEKKKHKKQVAQISLLFDVKIYELKTTTL